ncbi:BNR-4 repeat-containing protein [Lentzea sp. BCCO 10_0856]|uniref:BNR-4 repeat-containing protein n=1 Tax=Lentzea miocenica TaxID=3095431 RepID=A0ABU4SXQ0_9PSEU|nr:BNR-4 repeat-containing protein [Lentzea sp. BCCO 10_0856]MDX8030695.1 BNR-4 repeat-containing protein [Lentzea sp. BCCO 10_0856]
MRASAVALLLLVAFCQPAHAAATLDTVTTTSVYGCLRTNGAGVYDAAVNKTFVTYSGTNHDIYVKAFDHAANTWSAAVKVAALNLTHDNAYHDYPVLTQLGDGRLAVFRATHTSSMQFYTAPAPRSITGTWTARTISTDRNTYPEPVVIGTTIHLFYSHNTDLSHPYRTFKMIKSTDNGRTWSAPRMIIDSGRTADRYAEVYAFGVTQRNGRIYLTWSMHGGPKGHNGGGKNIYVAYFDTVSGNLFTVGGTSLATVIDAADLDKTRVVTTNPLDLPAGKGLPEENPVTVPLDDGSLVLGYGVHTRTSAKIVLSRFAGGTWTSTTADTSTSLFKDLVATGNSVHFSYASADRKRLLVKSWTPGGSVTPKHDLAVPYSAGADTTFYANFVENRPSDLVANTIDYETRKTNHTGKWPVFSLRG